MFQQMFALLKQMLPAEQYATLHSEMRKGNGVSGLCMVLLLLLLSRIACLSWDSCYPVGAT